MGYTLDDTEVERPVYSPVCMFCTHLGSVMGRTCEAFPGGIPDEIWEGRNKHRKPYPGDNGIQFEQRP